jgi:hypothetical protein
MQIFRRERREQIVFDVRHIDTSVSYLQ